MILLVHNDKVVTEIIDLDTNQAFFISKKVPAKALFYLANNFSERILIWCNESYKLSLNFKGIKKLFYLKNMMLSYTNNSYLSQRIGYVEDSPFLKVNEKFKYPTWLMSSDIGAIYGSQLLKFENKINVNNSFDYVLNSIAKLGMPNGLFCYSEPKLLKNFIEFDTPKQASNFALFKFVKQHYKKTWLALLLLNIIIHERKFPILAFLKSLYYKQKCVNFQFDLDPIQEIKIDKKTTIDVIIPTIGRKKYLFDVLVDLSNQTLLPKQVIIVEQNENIDSASELDYIQKKVWPFKIIHKFIHQTGACNSRNLALKEVTARYVYLADDDNKFGNTLLETIIVKMQRYNMDVITMSYLQENEVESRKNPVQWSTFGAGSSVIHSKYLQNIKFNMALEFGYGEDADFGMQLRNLGADIIYFPDIRIKHLKAPIGGFRTPFIHPWKEDAVQPKPSPTVMFNRWNNATKYQLLGYKTILFIKFYKDQQNKNPLTYFKVFKQQWEASQFWANQLKEQNR